MKDANYFKELIKNSKGNYITEKIKEITDLFEKNIIENKTLGAITDVYEIHLDEVRIELEKLGFFTETYFVSGFKKLISITI